MHATTCKGSANGFGFAKKQMLKQRLHIDAEFIGHEDCNRPEAKNAAVIGPSIFSEKKSPTTSLVPFANICFATFEPFAWKTVLCLKPCSLVVTPRLQNTCIFFWDSWETFQMSWVCLLRRVHNPCGARSITEESPIELAFTLTVSGDTQNLNDDELAKHTLIYNPWP